MATILERTSLWPDRRRAAHTHNAATWRWWPNAGTMFPGARPPTTMQAEDRCADRRYPTLNRSPDSVRSRGYQVMVERLFCY